MQREKSISALLDRLCVEFGFCLPPDDVQRLVAEPPVDPQQFLDEVIRREGLDPVFYDWHFYRQMLGVVQERFQEFGALEEELDE
jgi:hypothetical protein